MQFPGPSYEQDHSSWKREWDKGRSDEGEGIGCWGRAGVLSWVSLGVLAEPGPSLARSKEDFEESNLKYKY